VTQNPKNTAGQPVENSYIESFNGRLRDECLNVEVFFALSDVRDKLARWRDEYKQVRPHSALRDATPAGFARNWQEMRSAAVALPGAPACEFETKAAFRPVLAGNEGGAEKLLSKNGKLDRHTRPLLEVD